MTSLDPQLVIPGAQRSGSTYLAAWIGRHPQIFSRRGEYIGFEDPTFQERQLADLAVEVEDGVLIHAIRRADYLASRVAAERIRERLPDARILIVLRHPVARAMSAYYHYLLYGLLPVRSPDKVLSELFSSDAAVEPLALRNIRTFGLYAGHVRTYQELFGPEHVRVVTDEQVQGPGRDQVMTETLEWLDPRLDPTPPPQPEERMQFSMYSLPALRCRQLTKGLRYRFDPEHARTLTRPKESLNPVQTFILRGSGRAEGILSRRFPDGGPRVSPDVQDQMAAYYRPYVEELEQLLGWELPAWKSAPVAKRST